MKTAIRTAAVLLVLALAACSQKGFNTNLNIEPKPVPGVDWTKYSTWSFARQGEYVVTGNAILDEPTFRKGVGDHTIDEMNRLGYTHVDDQATADMLLMFHIIVEERYDEVKMNPNYQDFDMQWATMSEDDTWREGSLALFCIDTKTGKQIWGSVATAELDKQPNVSTAKQRFNEVVTKMLADFPKHTQ